MSWDLTDDTLLAQLQAYLDTIAADPDWHVNLYANDYEPAPGSTIGDYTPASFAGYLEADFSPGDFSVAAITGSHVAETTVPAVAFTRLVSASGLTTVYGYYVTDNTNTYRWGERFADPIEIEPGGSVSVSVRLLHTVRAA